MLQLCWMTPKMKEKKSTNFRESLLLQMGECRYTNHHHGHPSVSRDHGTALRFFQIESENSVCCDRLTRYRSDVIGTMCTGQCVSLEYFYRRGTRRLVHGEQPVSYDFLPRSAYWRSQSSFAHRYTNIELVFYTLNQYKTDCLAMADLLLWPRLVNDVFLVVKSVIKCCQIRVSGRKILTWLR